jgi:hypothetical protein
MTLPSIKANDQLVNSNAYVLDQSDSTIGSTNSIPRNVVSLEKLYDLQDKFKKVINCKINNSFMQFEVVSLGMNTIPQNINLGKNCCPEEK